MVSSVIWVVCYANPREKEGLSLTPLVDERFRVGADMMYETRFRQAMKMTMRDRVVIHRGGTSRSNIYAQHLVHAGCVKGPARNLTQEDAQKFKPLLDLTCQMFIHFQTAPGLLERQGIIFYQLFNPPLGVGPLPRPFSPPKPGMNFMRFVPGDPEYPQLDAWWHTVVPGGQCGKE